MLSSPWLEIPKPDQPEPSCWQEASEGLRSWLQVRIHIPAPPQQPTAGHNTIHRGGFFPPWLLELLRLDWRAFVFMQGPGEMRQFDWMASFFIFVSGRSTHLNSHCSLFRWIHQQCERVLFWDSSENAQRSGVCSAVRGRQLPLPQNRWPHLQRPKSGCRGGGWSSSFTTSTWQKSNTTAARQVVSKGQNQTNPVYIDSGRSSQPTRPSAPTAAPQDLLWHVSRRRPEASVSAVSTGCHSSHSEQNIIQNSLQYTITVKNYIHTAFTPKGATG